LLLLEIHLSSQGLFILQSSFDIGDESNIAFDTICKELNLEVEEISPLNLPEDTTTTTNIKGHRLQYIRHKT